MSKCAFRFEFDRPNRVYRSGETVSGRVQVTVNQTVACRALEILGLWQTHGKGNVAKGEYHKRTVFQGTLTEGDRQEFPFSFTIPQRPWTYRGNHVNVDHYVGVRVDVPWAFDPKDQADFIVLPGAHSNDIEAPLAEFAKKISTTWLIVGGVIGIALIVIGIPFLAAFGLGAVLIGIGLLVLYFTFRNFLAERLLGDVECVVAPVSQSPGGEFGVRIAFTPKRAGSLNGAIVTLTGAEIAVSGSGTNKTTHRHQLHRQVMQAAGETPFQPGTPVVIEALVAAPPDAPYSLSLGENKIDWTLEVRLDIPRWPDWYMSQAVIVVPPAVEAPLPINQPESDFDEPQSEYSAAYEESSDEGPTAGDYAEFAASHSQSAPLETAAATPVIPVVDSGPVVRNNNALLSVLRTMKSSGSMTADRTSLIASQANQWFDVVLVLDRIAYSYGLHDDPAYRSGRTLSGKLEGSEQMVAIQLPESDNDHVNTLRSGDRWSGSGRLIRWDELYDRMELRGTSD